MEHTLPELPFSERYVLFLEHSICSLTHVLVGLESHAQLDFLQGLSECLSRLNRFLAWVLAILILAPLSLATIAKSLSILAITQLLHRCQAIPPAVRRTVLFLMPATVYHQVGHSIHSLFIDRGANW